MANHTANRDKRIYSQHGDCSRSSHLHTRALQWTALRMQSYIWDITLATPHINTEPLNASRRV
jgi:hypothetical protein